VCIVIKVVGSGTIRPSNMVAALEQAPLSELFETRDHVVYFNRNAFLQLHQVIEFVQKVYYFGTIILGLVHYMTQYQSICREESLTSVDF
jgi:hypothetical protein